jgi:lipopolysaccharide/colanic/teichoic acid biosynthesis glycosyltransferase
MREGPYARGGKRLLDALAALGAAGGGAALMALVAGAVLLAFGRPVLFRDSRAGGAACPSPC